MRNIPLSRLPSVEAKIAELNKKAAKRNLPSLKLTTGATSMRDVTLALKNGEIKLNVEFIEVDVAGNLPVIDGYRWVGSVKVIDGCRQVYGDVPAEYRNHDLSYCDHCKTTRTRNQLTLVQQVETEKILLIGSTCHKEFFGEQNADTILSYSTMLEAFWDMTDEEFVEEDWNHGVARAHSLSRFLSAACEMVEKFGYISKEKAEQCVCLSTGDEAWVACSNSYLPAPWAERKSKAIIDYFNGIDAVGCSNYEFNVKQVVKVEHVSSKTKNIAASAVMAYDRVMAKRMSNENSEYQGVKGKRQDFTLHIQHIAFTENQWGTKRIYIMLDNAGNQFVWSTTSAISWEFTVEGEDAEGAYSYRENHIAKAGDTVTLRGTVDKHTEYKGVKNTYLKRCTILDLVRQTEKKAA